MDNHIEILKGKLARAQSSWKISLRLSLSFDSGVFSKIKSNRHFFVFFLCFAIFCYGFKIMCFFLFLYFFNPYNLKGPLKPVSENPGFDIGDIVQ